MNSGIIFSLILAALFFGGITWLIIHTRLRDKNRERGIDDPPPESKAASQNTK